MGAEQHLAHPSQVSIGEQRIELVEIGGDADLAPLLLLHEGLGSVGLWRDFPAALAERSGRRVFAFSRFGHGRSDPPPETRTPAFFHEEALEVLPRLLDALGIEEPLLIGHSDGASIALIHAAHRPVVAQVLIAPHVFVEEITVAAIRETRTAFEQGELRGRMARHHDDPGAAFFGWCDVWLDPEFAAWNLEAEAARLTAPTLLVQGTEDPYGTVEQVERIQRAARGPVSLCMFAAGHSPHFEAPEEVMDEIVGFLHAQS